MDFYQLPVKHVVRQLRTNIEKGLSLDDVTERLNRDGYNEFAKKRDPNQGIFTRSFTTRITIQALIIGGLNLVAYLIGHQSSLDVARTMTFAVIIFSQFTMIFSIRSGNKLFTDHFFSNRWLWATILLVVVLTLLVMLLPAMQSLFGLTTLTAGQWWITVGLSFGALILSELSKLLTVRDAK